MEIAVEKLDAAGGYFGYRWHPYATDRISAQWDDALERLRAFVEK